MPAATLQPERLDRVIAEQFDAFERDRDQLRFGTLQQLCEQRRRGGAADGPFRMRHPREIDSGLVEDRDRPLRARALPLDDFLKDCQRWRKGDLVDDLAVAVDRHVEGHDQLTRDRTGDELGESRTTGAKNLLERLPIDARRQRIARPGAGVEQLASVPVGQRYGEVVGILGEKDLHLAPKALDIVALQRLRERQHLQGRREALHLAVEHQPNAAHGIEHPFERGLAVADVLVIDEPAGKNDQRKRGAGDQQRKPNAQRALGEGEARRWGARANAGRRRSEGGQSHDAVTGTERAPGSNAVGRRQFQ